MDDSEFPAVYAEVGKTFLFNGRASKGTLMEVPVGSLRFPTGDVVADDPAVPQHPDQSALVFCSVPAGTYGVSLLILNCEPESPYPNVTAVKLKIGDEASIKTWEGARISQTGSVSGFGVDAGSGCLLDRSNLQLLSGDSYKALNIDDRLVQTLETGWCGWPGDSEEYDLLLYSCGMGDGVYPLYVGFDENRQIMTVLVDLEVLRHGERE